MAALLRFTGNTLPGYGTRCDGNTWKNRVRMGGEGEYRCVDNIYFRVFAYIPLL